MAACVLVPPKFHFFIPAQAICSPVTLSNVAGQVQFSDIRSPLSQNIIQNQPQNFTIANMSAIMNTSSASAAQNFSYDPLPDYASWYSEFDTWPGAPVSLSHLYVSQRDMKAKFWARHDISTWIEENCNQNVLVQAAELHSPGFNLYFLAPKDQQNFYEWFRMKEKRHQFIIVRERKEGAFKDVITWLNRNVTEGRIMHEESHSYHGSTESLTVHIENDHAAVLFKLRWCGPIPAVL